MRTAWRSPLAQRCFKRSLHLPRWSSVAPLMSLRPGNHLFIIPRRCCALRLCLHRLWNNSDFASPLALMVKLRLRHSQPPCFVLYLFFFCSSGFESTSTDKKNTSPLEEHLFSQHDPKNHVNFRIKEWKKCSNLIRAAEKSAVAWIGCGGASWGIFTAIEPMVEVSPDQVRHVVGIGTCPQISMYWDFFSKKGELETCTSY